MTLLPPNHIARALLPAGKIISLPNWTHQRVLLPAENPVSRWQKSQIYPAFRTPAKWFRFFMRARSSMGLVQARENPSHSWLLADFLRDVPITVNSAVVAVGAPGPAQKITVQLWNNNKIVGYLKYAEKGHAQTRLAHEHRILLALPDGLGPRVLKFGNLLNGKGLLTLPIAGRPLSPKLPPSENLWPMLARLQISSPHAGSGENHPWLKFAQTHYGDVVLPWVDKLTNKSWPVVLQHGDFTPWNLLQLPQGSLQAIDWEYAELQGMPFLDVAYFILQVSVLVKRWTAKEAKRFAVFYLNQKTSQELTLAESNALVNLAAYRAYHFAVDDGIMADDAVQSWRKTVWETKL